MQEVVCWAVAGVVAAGLGLACSDEAMEPSRASESAYNQDLTAATTSEGLTNADIAWHAVNTYGWDCQEVVEREPGAGSYFTAVCSNGTRLRVYPRPGQHPRITNSRGGYE